VEGTFEDMIMTRMITTIVLFLLVSCDLGVNSVCSTKGGRMCWAIGVILTEGITKCLLILRKNKITLYVKHK